VYETTAVETPAALATSTIVGRRESVEESDSSGSFGLGVGTITT
jgi:hypothetical protein